MQLVACLPTYSQGYALATLNKQIAIIAKQSVLFMFANGDRYTRLKQNDKHLMQIDNGTVFV